MARIQSEDVIYVGGDAELKGYLAWDADRDDPAPGVLVVHEWWGCTDHVRQRADALAGLGYAAMAVDMYGGGRTVGHPNEANELMTGLLSDMNVVRARLAAAQEVLGHHSSCDASRVAAIGYCMGGGIVLNAARYGQDLAAVASFHGSIGLGVAPAGEGTQIRGRVVAYNGEDDPFVSPEDIEALSADMASIGADYQFVNLPGAVHAFTNPGATDIGEAFGLPLRYNERADRCSWEHMCLLLESAFRGRD
jgi:dienelactone hydrolase